MDKLYKIIKSKKFIISGPCALEDYDTSLNIANFANNLCQFFSS